MHLHLSGGGVLFVPAPALVKALEHAGKNLIRTSDAKFALVATSSATAKRGAGLAAALAALAAPAVTHATLKRDLLEIKAGMLTQFKHCAQLVDAADAHAALLRACADHIAKGTPIPPTDHSHLEEAAKTLRRQMLVGDPDGIAAQTASVLRESADTAAESIATAKDFVVRKLKAATSCAIYKALRDKWQSAAIAAHMTGTPDAYLLDQEAKKSAVILDAYLDAYRKTFRGGANRRKPTLSCIDLRRLVRKSYGYRVEG